MYVIAIKYYILVLRIFKINDYSQYYYHLNYWLKKNKNMGIS